MKTKILVVSKSKLLQFVELLSEDKCVISIQDPKSFIRFKTKAKILYLKFHDVEEGSQAISENDATAIANFVIRNKNKDFIVSCEAGISRSSGVAGAISKHLYDNDEEFFKPPYNPNILCYRYVYNALMMIKGEHVSDTE